MSKSQREKGARGERQWRDQLREAGFQAHRGAAQAGDRCEFDPDVNSPDLPLLHFEVKRRAKIGAQAFLDQAERDCPAGKVPVVAMRADRGSWIAMLPADAFLEILRRSDLCAGEKPLHTIIEGYWPNAKIQTP